MARPCLTAGVAVVVAVAMAERGARSEGAAAEGGGGGERQALQLVRLGEWLGGRVAAWVGAAGAALWRLWSVAVRGAGGREAQARSLAACC